MKLVLSLTARTLFVSYSFLLLCRAAAFGAHTPTVEELLSYLRIEQAERDKLFGGQILSTRVTEAAENELAVGFVMFVPAPMEKLVDFVKSGKLLTTDRDVLSSGELNEKSDVSDFAGVAFTPDQSDEARNLLGVKPGLQFNLDTEENKTFRALKKQTNDKGSIRSAAGREYQELLLRRYHAYRKGGLQSIAPYDRGGGKASHPGEELRAAATESKLFAEHFPELHRALLDYPDHQPNGVTHRFFWINQNVENRPTFILSHRMSYLQSEGALLVERQYYVGHSYNSMQVMVGCMPAKGGSVVFYSNHTSTDQVAGFASAMRHSIGRGQMRDEIIKSFEQIRASLSK